MMESKLKKIVILGQSPLPMENFKKNFAPGARTWSFAKAAIDCGCKVLLIGIRIPHVYDENSNSITHQQIGDIEYYSIDGSIVEDKKWLEEKILEFNPDSIIGVTTYPASIIADLEIKIPFLADLYGSVMAEAQAKAHVFNDNSYLFHFFKMEAKILSKADVFTTVSEAQGFSLIGELGILGRLNKESIGYRFVRVIPAVGENKKLEHTKNVIRGKLADDSNFVILYSGGYNTWTDVETLFYGLEKAMRKNPKIIFISTGGKIAGHDEYTYEKFTNLINSSEIKDRFHLLGWVPHEDLHNFYFESDLGINSDQYIYEALLGSRTRILDWMRASLTFISTPLSEITSYLVKKDLAYSFKHGNSDDLAEKLLFIASNKDESEEKGKKLNKIYFEEFTHENAFKEFQNWIKNPQFSPDINVKVKLIDIKSPHILVSEGSLSKKQVLANLLWPIISKSLKTLRLQKYENNIKKTGESILSKNLENYRAKIFSIKSFEIESNAQTNLQVSIKNLGREWLPPSMSENGINLSYRWKTPKGKILKTEGIRTSITKIIKNNEKVNLEAKIKAPSEPGKYILEFDMVKEGHFWFSEAYKSDTRKVNVLVIN